MAARLLFSLIVSSFFLTATGQVENIYQMATGDDLSAYKHTDNFTTWQRITDNSIKKNKINSIYYRTLICTTIVNKKTGKIAHPLANIEVKAPEELKDEGSSVTGFLNIAGQKTVIVNDRPQLVTDTTQQFFHVTTSERLFGVELSVGYSQINSIYLNIFDNDISEVYSKKDDEADKNKKEIEPPIEEKEERGKISEKQAKAVFDLIFGINSSNTLTITDADKKQAMLFLTELIQRSCSMAVVEGLYNFEPSLYALSQSVYTTLSNCNTAKKGGYYEIIRKTIANNFKSSFQIRRETGDW